MSTRTARPGLATGIRIAAALTVVGSAVAATALTVREHDEPTSVVVTGVPLAGTAAPASQPSVPAPPAESPVAGPVPGPAVSASVPAAVPIGAGTPANSVPLHESGPSTQSTPAADTPTPLAGNPFAAAPAQTQPACPLGWPAPQQQGGLASLIGLAPLAGPFASEAFALGSVYQPLLQLVGPTLAQIEPVITRNQPGIDAFTTQVQALEATVLQAILPYYGPYRDQLIAAEGQLARQLTPILDRVYNSEIAACFVAWQGQLIAQSKDGRIRVASLAHPGTTVELGPER
ncbi:hypothetical protein [Nocardia miyunensis]|uniref:hypothetical protein n=1 Tax=Nocardia miyunensis TaxID=282684 RepID=UPI00082D54E8|nr:hypothetical protein [Nocardia miyunensis]